MIPSISLIIATTLFSINVQATVVDFIQGYTIAPGFPVIPNSFQDSGTPASCLANCINNVDCEAVAMIYPLGFSSTYGGDSALFVCVFYPENVPSSYLAGPMNLPYINSGAEWQAVMNIRSDDNVPSFPDLPATAGTCNGATSAGCFTTSGAGSSFSNGIKGSQSVPCVQGTWAADSNTLNACTLCTDSACDPTTGKAPTQTSCPAGSGLYNGLCSACPRASWSKDGNTGSCTNCAGQACDNTGAVTRCSYGQFTCDSLGNALSCAANFYLDTNNGCSNCDFQTFAPNNNTFTASSCNAFYSGDQDSASTNVCSDGTSGCQISTGNSLTCFAGNELIGNSCYPCQANMRQSLSFTSLACVACSIGQDSCSALGGAITCSAGYFFVAATTSTLASCSPCLGATTTAIGNRSPICIAGVVKITQSCPGGLYLNKASICVSCSSGRSSVGGVKAECKPCGFGATSCNIPARGVITITGCLPNLMLVKNRCLAVTCPAASFVIRDRCSPCNVGTTTFANNKLPQCPKCSTGASACTARGATACSIGYKLNGVKCTAQNTYDFIQGYTLSNFLPNLISSGSTFTPVQCLALCESMPKCKAIQVSTSGSTSAGTCNIYSAVVQLKNLVAVNGAAQYSNADQTNKALYSAVLNRRVRRSIKASITGLPSTAGTCAAGAGGCWTSCGINSTPNGNAPGASCSPCAAGTTGVPYFNVFPTCPLILPTVSKVVVGGSSSSSNTTAVQSSSPATRSPPASSSASTTAFVSSSTTLPATFATTSASSTFTSTSTTIPATDSNSSTATGSSTSTTSPSTATSGSLSKRRLDASSY